MPFHKRVVKHTGGHPYHGILLSNVRGEIIDTCDNLDAFQGSYATCEKPIPKDYMVCRGIYATFLDFRSREHISGCQGFGKWGEGREVCYKKAKWRILVVTKLFYILTLLVETWTCRWDKLYRAQNTERHTHTQVDVMVNSHDVNILSTQDLLQLYENLQLIQTEKSLINKFISWYIFLLATQTNWHSDCSLTFSFPTLSFFFHFSWYMCVCIYV